MIKDYYSVLGVMKTASREEIISAFRSLAKKYHPDKNNAQNATSKFREVYKAYEILKDSSKRNEYDKLYEKYFENRETINPVYYEEINNWASKAGSNFEKYVNLNFNDFLKVTLEKVTYQGIKSLRFVISVVLFVITLSFTFFSIIAFLGLWGHIQNNSITIYVILNFSLVLLLQIGLIFITRKLTVNYQKQYKV